MLNTLREEFFDPDFMELNYITEETTLYALKIHGYISNYLYNRLRAYKTVGELIDTPIKDIMSESKFGPGCRKELKSFFSDNNSKFRLKGYKKEITKKKKKNPELIIKQLSTDLENRNLDVAAHKSLEITLYEEIDTLNKSIDLVKKDYDNYYKDSFKNLNEKLKVKEIQIGTLQLSNNEAYKALKSLKTKIDEQQRDN